MNTQTTIRGLSATMLALGLLATPGFAEPEKKSDSKEMTAETLKEKAKEKETQKGKPAETPKATPAPAKTGFAALKDRVAELREIAKDLKQNDRDKAAAKVNAVADQLEKDIAAMEKSAADGKAKGELPKDIRANESGREGNRGQGVGHGRPAEPGTGKPATVGPPAAKPDKEKKAD